MSIRFQVFLVLVVALLVAAGLNVAAAVALLVPQGGVVASGLPTSEGVSDGASRKPSEASEVRGEGRFRLFLLYLGLNSVAALALGMLTSSRSIARRVEGLVSAANRIGRLELDDPFEGRPSLLGPLGLAFERMAANLKAE